jgi:acyl-CoA reductase-like NAD-dependent aldehyde dehydrogenase
VTGLGEIVGAELARNPDVAKISFTGSAAVGEKIMRDGFVRGTDIARARRVASQILAGRVAINGMFDDPQAPFGGFKHSGVGREFGTFGIEAFLESRAILE